MSDPKKTHTNREFELELKKVRTNLVDMSNAVKSMIDTSVESLLDGKLDLAKATIKKDQTINRFEVDTDDLCLVILAKRQPMASDLRFITLAMKMVTDLERIGDLAVNISERALALDGFKPTEVDTTLRRMSQITQGLIRDAIDSFVEQDPTKAETVIKRDSEVDQLYLAASNEIQKRMHNEPDFLYHGIHLQAAAKFLERIGDHITNLAELVIFMVWGKDIRHLGKLADESKT